MVMNMNWLEIINNASEYIEKHIHEEIKLEEIAKDASVSYYHFSKMFSAISGYTIKEYIRNRRITLASYEVAYTKNRIIDIAVKYNYSSNEAFTRAFKQIHGITPSDARNKQITVYTHFPVIKFDIPNRNLIALQYELIENQRYDFNGVSTFIYEEDYDETQYYLNRLVSEFCDQYNIKDRFRNQPKVYRVLHDVDLYAKKYNFLVGFHNSEKKDDALTTYSFEIKKAIKFTCTNINENQIPNAKKIIYSEWEKTRYRTDSICEIEYIIMKEYGLLDFIYIVSIF